MMTKDLIVSLAIGCNTIETVEGSWSEDSNKYSVCFGRIFHQLICEAARMCTVHASDIYYDLKTIEEQLSAYAENETKYYFYGFYREGVANLLKTGTEDDLEELKRYRSIWVLKIHKEGCFISLALGETNPYAIERCYDQILEISN